MGKSLTKINITSKLLSLVKQGRSCYFSSQKEHSLQTFKSDRDIKIKEVNEQIEEVNSNTSQLQKNINSSKEDADKYAFNAEKQTKLENV